MLSDGYNVHLYPPTPPHHLSPTVRKKPPRPLPSCLDPKLKTGTDLVKKQEVMKSSLGQPKLDFFNFFQFHDILFSQAVEMKCHEY